MCFPRFVFVHALSFARMRSILVLAVLVLALGAAAASSSPHTTPGFAMRLRGGYDDAGGGGGDYG
jgi:hypothetical protein